MELAGLWTWAVRSARRQATPFVRARRVGLSVERLEAREVLTLNPSGNEQQMLELVNQMRMDPKGELSRLLVSTNPLQARDLQVQAALEYFGVSGAALASQWASLTPAQPLAWSDALMTSALQHNQKMIAADQQSHQLPGEAGLGTRITAEGYTNWSAVGENIYAYATNVSYGHAGFAIDWGTGPGGIQSPAGHRQNIMNNGYREVGISVVQETSPATQVGPSVITQDFGNRFSFGNAYLLGVVYTDSSHNNRYDAGEGLSNVSVSITGSSGNFTTTTMSAGGYQLKVPSGTYTVSFSGGGLPGTITKSVTVGAVNVKLDGIAGQPGGGGGGSSNHAPVLNIAGNFTLATVLEDTKSYTTKTVATILGTNVTDVDANALKGIAVTGVDTAAGTWQYTTNGSKWLTLGSVSGSAALLLRSTDSLRFLPKANFNGEADFTFRAWDRTTGTTGTKVNLTGSVGGSTAYGAELATAKVLVKAVNDAPVLKTSTAFNLNAYSNNGSANPGTLVSTLLGTKVTDPDAGAVQGIAVTTLAGTSSGAWQFSTDGGQTWLNFGTTSTATARLLRSTDLVRFVPKTGYKGQVSFQFRAWDLTTGIAGGTINLRTSTGSLKVGGTYAFSSSAANAYLKVL